MNLASVASSRRPGVMEMLQNPGEVMVEAILKSGDAIEGFEALDFEVPPA